MLDKGAEVDAVKIKGSTALHHAADYGYFYVVRQLLAYKARTVIKDNAGWTPTRIAEHRGKHAIVDLLETETD